MTMPKISKAKVIALTFVFAMMSLLSSHAAAAPSMPTMIKVMKSSGGGYADLTVVGSKFYFSLRDTVLKQDELWSSDGTSAGTKMIKALNSNLVNGGGFYVLGQLNSKIYFRVKASDEDDSEVIWASDGTEVGTILLGDSTLPDFRALAGGTLTTPILKLPINLGKVDVFIKIKNKTYFQASNGKNGEELWVTDGSKRGTFMVKDINPKGDSLDPQNHPFYNTTFYAVGSKVFFRATDGKHGYELWSSDGTAKGTKMVKDINLDGDAMRSRGIEDIVFNSKFYFIAHEVLKRDDNGYLISGDLWETDGTLAGTQKVKFAAGYAISSPAPIRFGSSLYMTATDGKNGTQLWKISG